MMIRRCAWCEKTLGTKEGEDGITDGICPDCYAKQWAELEEDIPLETQQEYEDWLLYEDSIALPEPETIDED